MPLPSIAVRFREKTTIVKADVQAAYDALVTAFTGMTFENFHPLAGFTNDQKDNPRSRWEAHFSIARVELTAQSTGTAKVPVAEVLLDRDAYLEKIVARARAATFPHASDFLKVAAFRRRGSGTGSVGVAVGSEVTFNAAAPTAEQTLFSTGLHMTAGDRLRFRLSYDANTAAGMSVDSINLTARFRVRHVP